MLTTTPGRILADDALPQDLRDPTRVWDKKAIGKVFQDLAEKHPEKYREISHRLLQLGGEMAFAHGGLTFGPEHLRPARAALHLRARIQHELRQILVNPRLDDAGREKAIVDLADRYRKPMEEGVFQESLAEDNPLALQVLSGVRGNRQNVASLRGGDLLYADHRGRPIPVPVLRSYSEGLSPAEYWAGAYGARRGVVEGKLSVAKAGYTAKQLIQAAHRLIVTAKDADEESPDAADRGLPVDANDPDNEGALLARPVAGFARNTVLTPKVLAAIRDAGEGRILVRSPLVGGPADGGVYGRDVGVREKGRLAPRGDYVGHAASSALGEKTAQMALSAKHGGGVVGVKSSPYQQLDQLMNPPETYAGAAHAQVDGHVGRVEAAPQGGHYVHIAGERHYVRPEHAVKVTAGDEVEAGDAISEGLPNPAEIVAHKGIGEGRRYLASTLRDLFKSAGTTAHRRNAELVARGLIDHVRVEDDIPGTPFLPGDVAPYQAIEAHWEPREGAEELRPAAAVGKYLEKPVIHLTLGTKIRPKTAKELESWGIRSVLAHPEPPPFTPELIPARTSLSVSPDWSTRHLGFGLAASTAEAVHRSRTADPHSTSFVPAMLSPETFGREGPTQGWDPDEDDEDDD